MNKGDIQFAEYNNIYILKFIGALNLNYILNNNLNNIILDIFNNPNFNNIILDLTNTLSLDSTTLGLIGKINVYYKKIKSDQIDIYVYNDDVIRLLESLNFDTVFNIIKTAQPTLHDLKQIPNKQFNQEEFENIILESHKILQTIDHKNEQEFSELINCLKNNQ